MHLGTSSDYFLSFQVKGIPFLIVDLSVQGFNGIDVVDMSKAGVFFQYFPTTSCERYAKEGLALYGNAAAFHEYIERIDNVRSICETHAHQILNSKNIEAKDLEPLFAGWIEFSRLYFCMGIEYTDLAITKLDDPIVAASIKELETRKNPVREYVNQSFINNDSYLDRILTHLEKQTNVPKENLWEYGLQDLLALCDGAHVSQDIIQARKQAVIAHANHGDYEYLWGEEALAHITAFENTETISTESVSGAVANSGPAIQGRVTIIDVNYQDFAGMNAKMSTMTKGSVLVAQTTAPELMLACKKAAAIVTDLGGLMSHAAIVSRELGIPCIVGTRHATKTFQNGDLVEVDTQQGTIRKIK